MNGILFKPWKIKAIADNPTGEWQTRRRIDIDQLQWIYKGIPYGLAQFEHKETNERITIRPRHQVGGIVYIKEAWATSRQYDNVIPRDIPNHSPIWLGYTPKDVPTTMEVRGKWRSPMFLREIFARYFIQITGVRAERLQEITLEDIYDEGIDVVPSYDRIDAYKRLWDSINPMYPWDTNPFVWRYSFVKVIK